MSQRNRDATCAMEPLTERAHMVATVWKSRNVRDKSLVEWVHRSVRHLVCARGGKVRLVYGSYLLARPCS